jgi:hypothetical protein
MINIRVEIPLNQYMLYQSCSSLGQTTRNDASDMIDYDSDDYDQLSEVNFYLFYKIFIKTST